MTATTRPPLLLLDVDGVLNAISRKGDPSAWPDWQQALARNRHGSWPILYSPTVVSAVRRWHDEGLAEITWLTTWLHDANGELRDLLGLPAFPVLGARQYERAARPAAGPDEGSATHADFAGAHVASQLTGRWWKFDAVLDVVASQPGRPLVWIDDDLRVERAVQQWMRMHTTCLLMTPSTHVGLIPRHLQTVEDWLLQHALGSDDRRGRGSG